MMHTQHGLFISFLFFKRKGKEKKGNKYYLSSVIIDISDTYFSVQSVHFLCPKRHI